jgi:thymidylate synthase (FAD)
MMSPWIDPVLKPKDRHLIKFLARGCTTKDWEGIVEDVTGCGYGQAYDDFSCNPVTDLECDALDLELRGLLNHVKRMPSHWVPFANGGQIKLHFKVPLFVARQLQKHTAGFNPWSEVSRRYVDSDPEFYVPDVWRGRSADKKQGSSGVCQPPMWIDSTMNQVLDLYDQMIHDGVAPEQARMVLPQSMMTEWYWSGSLDAFADMCRLRTSGDTQAETQEVAWQIYHTMEELFPVSWVALMESPY